MRVYHHTFTMFLFSCLQSNNSHTYHCVIPLQFLHKMHNNNNNNNFISLNRSKEMIVKCSSSFFQQTMGCRNKFRSYRTKFVLPNGHLSTAGVRFSLKK